MSLCLIPLLPSTTCCCSTAAATLFPLDMPQRQFSQFTMAGPYFVKVTTITRVTATPLSFRYWVVPSS